MQILNVQLGHFFDETKHVLVLGSTGSGKTSTLLLLCYLFNQNRETILWRDDTSTEWLSLVEQFPWRVFVPVGCEFCYKHPNVEYIYYDPFDLRTLFNEIKRGAVHAIEFDPFVFETSAFIGFWSRFFYELYRWKGPDARSKIAFFTDELNDLAAGTKRGYVPRQLQLASNIYLCLPPDQLVYEDQTIKPIGDVQEGERVLTHSGHFRNVTGISRHPFKGELVSLRTFYNYPVLLTPNHTVLVKRFKRYGSRMWQPLWMDGPQESAYLKTQVGFLESSDVRAGDLLWLPKIVNFHLGQRKYMDVHQWVRGKISDYTFDADCLFYKEKKKIPRFIALDYDFGKLLGYYIAEGTVLCDCTNVNFTFNRKEKDLMEDVIRLMEKCFNIDEHGTTEAKDAETTHLIFCSKIVATFLAELCGQGAINKHLPSMHLSFSLEVVCGLLHGLFKGDGYASAAAQTSSYSTVSPILAHQIRELMLRLKWLVGVNKQPPSTFGNYPQFLCAVPKAFNFDFNDKIGFGFDGIAQDGPFQSVGHQSNYGEGFWLRVRDVGRVPYCGDVVNLEVAGDSTFVANGITVHNSQKKYRKEKIRLVSCYDTQTRVLTQEGLKTHDSVKPGDLGLSINPQTKRIEWKPILNIYAYNYAGKMIHFKDKSFDVLVTPNHKMLLLDQSRPYKWQNLKFEEASKTSKRAIFATIKTLPMHFRPKYKPFGNIPQEEDYSGVVWCPEVADNHNLLVERNGRFIFCGNSTHGYGDLHKPVREGFQFYIFKQMHAGQIPDDFKRYEKVIERLAINEAIIVDEARGFNKITIDELVKPKRISVRWKGVVKEISKKKTDELAQWKTKIVMLAEVMHTSFEVPYKDIARFLGYSEQSGLANLMKKHKTSELMPQIETFVEQLKQLEKAQAV